MLCVQVAVAHELPVASPRWVFESFRAQKLLDVKEFQLKVLEGMGVCASGLTVEEKETVEHLAATLGAQYDGRLELGFTSVLVAKHPEGAKYEAAVDNDIPVVHLGWLYACLERQMLVEEDEFALLPEATDPDLQVVCDSVSQRKLAQELVRALPECMRKYRRREKGSSDDATDNDEDDEPWIDLFDCCVVHLLGFPPQMSTLLQQLIRAGMGTIYHTMVTHHVTHVIVSASLSDKQTLETIRTRASTGTTRSQVHFVSASWLLDCVKCLDLQPEELYPVEFDLNIPEQVSATTVPAVRDSNILLDHNQAHAEVIKDVSLTSITVPEELLQREDGNSTMAKDSDTTKACSKTKQDGIFAGYSFLLLCRDPEDKHMIAPTLANIRGERGGAEAIAIAAIDFSHVDPAQFLFISHAVVCTGVMLDEQESLAIQDRIHESQRHFNTRDAVDEDNVTDVADRPVKRMRHNASKPRQRLLQFVSDLWVNCSLAARTKLSFSSHELFGTSANYPRALFPHSVPLPGFEDVVASTSVYRDVEQLVVVELLRIAGARVTSTLSKRNTHLVCRMPFGMKYDKAIKRGLHVVRARWVVDSLVAGKRLREDVSDFSVIDGDGETSSFTHIASNDTADLACCSSSSAK
uniref:BRCT domain-containing protein n=1 Tax=Hyaloperonospora arabidopsidis (strain Emoy2) TaxID=559515 RepID=M4BGU3_HYAAE